ncbi:MAG TPA: HWE histidine kinase domain-containing protein [Rhodanobacteraceae bacterium]|nr:HWE histidine kinase domain-containing protein [Rhodanobacteraceae bacterium]
MTIFKRRTRASGTPRDRDRGFDFLPAHGEMAQLIRHKDWSKTALGTVEQWPQPLRTALAICLDSKFPTYMWWGPELIEFYNDACIPILRAKHPDALGKSARQAWSDVWPEIGPLAERVMATGEGVFAENLEMIPERDNTLASAYFTFCYSPLRDAMGNVAGVFVTALETTEMILSEAALRESETRLQRIMDSARDYAIVSFDAEGRITSWNVGAERLLGFSEREAVGKPGSIFFTPEDRAAGVLEQEMARARDKGRAADERWHMRKDGTRFWGSGLMLPMVGHKRDRYLKIFRDNTELRRAQERQALLTQELTHRVKNTLAIVQSIAMQTLRQSASMEEARDALELRLVALARAHDMLVAGNWSGGALREVVAKALGPYGDNGDSARIRCDGPDVRINARAVVGLSLALHELATNAAKYGALSNQTGQVDVRWEISGGANRRFCLRWRESGGPAVEPPRRRGFGTRSIEEGLAQEIQGEIELDFAPEGLSCTIRAPLQEIADSG